MYTMSTDPWVLLIEESKHMALNASKVASSAGPQAPALDPANYLARVVQVIDLGLQPQRPYEGQEKPPAYELRVVYELGTEFLLDDDGKDDLTKPRWVDETFPLRSIKADKATSTKRLKALDPKNVLKGDFAELGGYPCTLTVVTNEGKGKHAGKTFTNVGAVTPPMKGFPVPELVNPIKVFDLDNPDKEVFEALPEWLREKVASNLEYQGSALQHMLEDTAVQKHDTTETPIAIDDDDMPY